ncbi:hypothetical protein SCUP234_10799 [Seiridium cupressi]
MASSVLSPSTDAVIETCSANTQALIRDTIGEILRHQGLSALERARDDALRAIDRSEPDPMAFFLYQQQVYHERCTGLLRRIRPDLHGAIDDLVDELENDLSVIEASKQLMSPVTPWKSNGHLEPPVIFGPVNSSQPRAPVAEMADGTLALSHRARSATLAASEGAPAPQALPKPAGSSAVRNGTHNGRATQPTSPQTKRAVTDIAPTTPRKRAKAAASNASKTVTPPTTGSSSSRTKKQDQAKKPRDPDDDEYRHSGSEEEFPTLKELDPRNARATNPKYIDKPVEENEFAET